MDYINCSLVIETILVEDMSLCLITIIKNLIVQSEHNMQCLFCLSGQLVSVSTSSSGPFNTETYRVLLKFLKCQNARY